MIKKFLTKLLPPRERIFFTYFENSANICRQASDVLFAVIHKGLTEERMVLARDLKHKNNDLTKLALTRLNATFITPLDREDIQHVNLLLNKISRKIAKATLIFKTYQLTEYPETLKQQADIMLEAAKELNVVVDKFKHFKKVGEITKSNERMDEIETRGDDALYHAMLDLFSGKYNPLTVIKLRDIYNNIESALDLCFSVSDTIVNIVLKHT
jgi:uncharacterized protein Yka (UPF0111/DUF47 family)